MKQSRRSKPVRSQKQATSDADRRLRQADRLSRILRVLQLLQSRGHWNAATIAEALEVSKRTVHRDLTVLELAGIPWAYDADRKCYQLRSDFRFPTLNLTDDELLGQAAATKLSEATGLDIGLGAKPTAEKLATSGDRQEKLLSEARELIEVLDLKLVDHRHHRESLHTIQWALLSHKQLAGLYRSPYESKPIKLRLHPFRLCLVKSCWYLIARPTDQDKPITLRATRFKSLRMLDEPAIVPKEFDLSAYFGNAWGVYRGDQTYDVMLRFEPGAAEIAAESCWHHSQRTHRNKDGSAEFSFRIDGLNEIVRWILGWAGKVTVLKPKELRELVIEQHRTAIRNNQSE